MTKGKPDDTLPHPHHHDAEDRPTAEIRRSRIPKGPPPIELQLDVKRIPKGTLVVDLYDAIDEVLIIRSGRLILETADRTGEKLLKDYKLELGPRQVLFEELLTHEGESGPASNYRVTAKDDVEAYVITMYDLIGDDADPIKRRKLLYLVLNAMAEATAHGRRLHAAHREDEDDLLQALDDEREKVGDLRTRNGELNRKIALLEEQNRQLTVSAVDEVVRRELRRLMKEASELREKLRIADRKVIDAEATAASANNYIQALTDDLVRLEQLRDLLELETADPKVFLSEVHRVFLALLSTNDHRLQILGVHGLGVLSDLSNRSERGSLIPPPPTKNPLESG